MTTCEAPRTKKKVRVSPKGWRTIFDSSSAKIHNFRETAKCLGENCEGREWDMRAEIRGGETDERREILHRYSIVTPSLLHR